MAKIHCWEATMGEEERHWTLTTAPRCVRLFGRDVVLQLPAGHRAFCDGLPVIAGIHAIRKGSLVRIRTPENQETAFVLGGVAMDTEPGRRRPCQFCGWPIRGEATVCGCGATYCKVCGDPQREEARCTSCGQGFDVAAEPPSESLL